MSRIVVNPDCVAEAFWRREWDSLWGLARERGWTAVLTDEDGSDPIEVLRADADCTLPMGSLDADIRRYLVDLQRIGWLRGWLREGA